MHLPTVRVLGGFGGVGVKGAARSVSAAVTLLALAIPLNIGYAQIAGLPASAGLATLVVPAIVFALLTTSRQLVAAPDASAAALVASALAPLAADGSVHYAALAAAQAIVGGIVFGLFWLFRLGFLADFLSEAVLVGFVGGLAAEILVSQIAKMLGVSIEAEEFFAECWELITRIPEANLWSVVVSVLGIAVLVVGRRLAPGVPWALVVLVTTTVLVVVADLAARGVAVLGPVEAGLPPLQVPSVSLAEVVAVAPSALALTLVALAEGLLTARHYSERHGYAVDANAELLAFGGANVAAGLFGGFTVGSSASRTAAVDQARSPSQWAAVIAALLAIPLLLWGTALLAEIPAPALGAVVAVAVVPIIGFGRFRRLWRLRRSEFAVAASCFLGVLVLGPIRGVILAFLLAVVDVVRRAASPPVDALGRGWTRTRYVATTPAAEVDLPDGVVVLRFAAQVFFANATAFKETVTRLVEPPGTDVRAHALVIDAEAITDIDVTGSAALEASLEWCTSRDVRVVVSRLRVDLAETLARYGLLEGLEVFDTNADAVRAVALSRDDRAT